MCSNCRYAGDCTLATDSRAINQIVLAIHHENKQITWIEPEYETNELDRR